MITSAWLEIFVRERIARKSQLMSKLDKVSPVWEISIAFSKAVINILAVFMFIHYQLSPVTLLQKYSKDVASPWRDPLKKNNSIFNKNMSLLFKGIFGLLGEP